MPKKEYTNGELTVVWKSEKCIHAGECVKGLNSVFDPNARPWVNLEGATTKEIAEVVDKCPSGALSYFMNSEGPNTETVAGATRVEIRENGPMLVHGSIEVTDTSGNVELKEKTTAFCRCGASGNKPYCDGMHRKVDFKG